MRPSPRLVVAAASALAAFVAVVGTLPGYGFAIDEATHVWVNRELQQWVRQLPRRPIKESFTVESLQQGFRFLESIEHRPLTSHSNFNLPVTDYLMAGSRLLTGWVVGNELTSYRLGMAGLFALAVGLTAWTISGVVRTADPTGSGDQPQHGRWLTGLLAAGLLIAQPRVFGHAHLAATETPLGSLWLISVLCLWQWSSLPTEVRSRRWWVWGTILAVGLTCAVKMTGWFLPIALIAWLMWHRPIGWKSMLVGVTMAGPIMVVVLTPPLWHAPVSGLISAIESAGKNPWKITGYYLGQPHQDGLPWHSVFVLLAVTVPLTTLITAGIGLFWSTSDRRAGLLLLNIGILLVVRMVGKMPQHDGDRQFIPIYYLLPILGAVGVERLAVGLTERRRWTSTTKTILGTLGVGLLLIEPLLDLWTYRQHGLCYYNRAIGGLAGADRAGFEVSYWYETLTDADWRRLFTKIPPNSRIFFRPDHPGTGYLQEWGIMPREIVGAGPNDAHYAILYAKKAAYANALTTSGEVISTTLLLRQQSAPAEDEVRFQGVRLAALIAIKGIRDP